jgi:hypothetical protein
MSLLIGIFVPALTGQTSRQSLKQELVAQHFSGLLKGDVHLTTLGTLRCGNKHLRVIFYEWYETNPPGEAIHASLRVILMDNTTYLGFYAVEDRPKIQDDILRFPYSAYGNTISCGKKGVLPKNAWLDGEIIPLSK